MAFLAYLVLFLALVVHPCSGTYCICRDGVSESQLQKALDYACGAGADCTPILQNGACYQPNTVKDHCSYAVNSYFQRKGQVTGSCDFSQTATTSNNPPTTVASACVYPSSPSNAVTASPTPTTGTGTSTGTGTGTGAGTPTPTVGTGTGTGTGTSTTPTSVTPTPFVGTGLGPTGSGTGLDGSGVGAIEGTKLFYANLTLWFSGLLLLLWG